MLARDRAIKAAKKRCKQEQAASKGPASSLTDRLRGTPSSLIQEAVVHLGKAEIFIVRPEARPVAAGREMDKVGSGLALCAYARNGRPSETAAGMADTVAKHAKYQPPADSGSLVRCRRRFEGPNGELGFAPAIVEGGGPIDRDAANSSAGLRMVCFGLCSVQSSLFAAMLALDGVEQGDRRPTFDDSAPVTGGVPAAAHGEASGEHVVHGDGKTSNDGTPLAVRLARQPDAPRSAGSAGGTTATGGRRGPDSDSSDSEDEDEDASENGVATGSAAPSSSAGQSSSAAASSSFLLSGASSGQPPSTVGGGDGSATGGRSVASRSRAGSSVGTAGYSESAVPLGYEKPDASGPSADGSEDPPGALRVDANGASVQRARALRGKAARSAAQLRESVSTARKLTRGVLPVLTSLQAAMARVLERATGAHDDTFLVHASVLLGALRLASGRSVPVRPVAAFQTSGLDARAQAELQRGVIPSEMVEYLRWG